MEEWRNAWKTKTFYGAVGYAILVLLGALGIDLPYETLLSLITVWTGYSVADRLRTK